MEFITNMSKLPPKSTYEYSCVGYKEKKVHKEKENTMWRERETRKHQRQNPRGELAGTYSVHDFQLTLQREMKGTPGSQGSSETFMGNTPEPTGAAAHCH